MAVSVKPSPKLTNDLHAAKAAQENTAADSQSRERAKDYLAVEAKSRPLLLLPLSIFKEMRIFMGKTMMCPSRMLTRTT